MAFASPLIVPGMTPQNGAPVTLTDETLALVRQSIQQREQLNRSIDTTYSGFQGYDLKGPAEVVTPTETMFLSSLPRVNEGGYTIHHFNAITKLGWNGIQGVVDDGGVASEITPTTVQLFVIAQSIAAQQSITFQEEWRTRGFSGDLKAQMMSLLLYSLKLIEENWLISGCDYLWSPPAPLPPTTAATGGSIAAGTYYVAVSAITANGETFATLAANQGVTSSVTTAGTTSTISVTAFRVPYATGYNVYVGTATNTLYKQVAANFSTGVVPGAQSGLSMIGNFTFTLSSLTTTGTTQPTANTAMVAKGAGGGAVNLPLMNNGILALIFSAGNQTYPGPSNASTANTPTSAYSAAGQTINTTQMLGLSTMGPTVIQPASTAGTLAYSDIQQLFLAMYQNALAKPTRLAMSAQDAITVTNLLQNAAGTRFVVDASKPEVQANLVYGMRVGKLLNPITQTVMEVEVWPYLPQGTIVALSDVLPWPVPNFNGKTMEVRVNQDYRGFDYPPTAQYQKWAFADYVDEALKINFLGGFGAITGIMPTVL